MLSSNLRHPINAAPNAPCNITCSSTSSVAVATLRLPASHLLPTQHQYVKPPTAALTPPGACPCPSPPPSPADISAQAIQEMQFNIVRVLGSDTQSISAMRCLRLYLERLGHSFQDPRSQHGLSGLAKILVTGTLYDTTFLNCRPSVVAAAVLYAERRLRGCVPFWPSMLAKLTGHQDMSSPELTVAVSPAQLPKLPSPFMLMHSVILAHAHPATCVLRCSCTADPIMVAFLPMHCA